MPTLSQACNVTGHDWSINALLELFRWLRPSRGMPSMADPIDLREALCLWTYDLCRHSLRLPPKSAEAVFSHISPVVREWVPKDCTDERAFTTSKYLLVVADDRWAFCTFQKSAWDLQQELAVDSSAICASVKSTAYNLSLLSAQHLVACQNRDPQTGRSPEDGTHAHDRQTPAGPAPGVDQP